MKPLRRPGAADLLYLYLLYYFIYKCKSSGKALENVMHSVNIV